jgi:hypothetical protein
LSAVALERRRKITQHVPGPGERLVRYYGWYSNKLRGLRRRQTAGGAAAPAVAVCEDSQATTAASASIAGRRRRQRWAELIRRVYGVDPLRCPRCGGRMKIIAFLEPRDQAAAIARILRHRGLCLPVRPARRQGSTRRRLAPAVVPADADPAPPRELAPGPRPCYGPHRAAGICSAP